MADSLKIRRALISVYDKHGLVEFARRLVACGVEIVSSGGTARALLDAEITVTAVEAVTGAAEMLGGRVKTLHPAIHGGILADLAEADHRRDLAQRGIEPFQLVVSNLYPFERTVESGADETSIIEQIDIGGPAMVRAGAKNHRWVGIVTSPDQYDVVAAEVEAGGLSTTTRRQLARDAFFHTARYDAAIVDWMHRHEELPSRLVVPLEAAAALRYGENPHQAGVLYRQPGISSWWDSMTQHAGLALSYLNLFDVEAAWRIVHDVAGTDPAAVIVKHANPCGAAIASTLHDAYQRAYECDSRSAFGGIVAFNRPVDADTVERMEAAAQADVVIAPGYEQDVVERLIVKRKNTRILEAGAPAAPDVHLRQISGGWLGQNRQDFAATPSDWQVVTERRPTDAELADAAVMWRICGHVKSNAIVVGRDRTAWGIGAGQQNRVEAGQLAAAKAAGRAAGGALASDAFFPFPDGLDAAATSDVAVVIQPGGALRDDAVIERANELGLAMIMTGERQFLH